MLLTIIIPVYNEVKYLEELINRLEVVRLKLDIESEVIIVDDNSSDESFELLNKLTKDKSNYVLIRHDINKGKGAAIREGIKVGKGDLFIILDADLELLPEEIPYFLKAQKELNVEMVNGSRYLQGVIRLAHDYKRYKVNQIFTSIASFLVNTCFTDLTCGYKLFTRKVVESISLKENRFGIETELLIKTCRKFKYRIAEVPVRYFPRTTLQGKKFKNVDVFRIFWVIIKYALFKQKVN